MLAFLKRLFSRQACAKCGGANLTRARCTPGGANPLHISIVVMHCAGCGHRTHD